MEPAQAVRRPAAILATASLAAFLVTLGLDWPAWLPLHARLADLFFLPAAVAIVSSRQTELRFSPIDALVLAYLAGAIPSLVVAGSAAGYVEWARHVYLALVYVVVALAVVQGRSSVVHRAVAVGGSALALCGVAFVAVDQIAPMDIPALGERMSVPYIGDALRLRAGTSSPAMLACLLTVTAPLAFFNATSSLTRAWLWHLAVAVSVVATVLTFSPAIAGCVVALIVVTWRRLPAARPLRAAAVATVALIVLAFNLTLIASVRSIGTRSVERTDSNAFHHAVDRGELQLGSLRVDYDVMSYFRVKQLALEAFRQHPWSGVGLDRFHDVTERAFQDGRLPSVYRAIDPHSSLLGRLAETGLIGGLSLLVLWAGILWVALRLMAASRVDGWLARAVTAGVVGLLVNSINTDIMNFRFLWVGMGVLRGLLHEAES